MVELVELGKVSSKGQVAIPADIRHEMHLEAGSKILFLLAGDSLIIKRVTPGTFAEVTKPFKEAAKKAGLTEEDVPEIIARVRGRK